MRIVKKELILVTYSEKGCRDPAGSILTDLARKKLGAVYVDTGKSCAGFFQKLRGLKINPAGFFCVDCTGEKTGAANSISVKSPESLTELSIAITEVLLSGKFDFLVFDSPFTLLTYNKEPVVIRFVQFVCNKLRALGVGGIIIIPATSSSKELINNVAQAADRRVSL